MVSYYNSLAMFPQPSRPGSGPPPPSVSASSLYSSYSHYNQDSAVAGQSLHDQNSNLQLYAAFSPAPGSHAPGPAPGWPHSWSQFPPGSCRGAYDWGGGAGGGEPRVLPQRLLGAGRELCPLQALLVARARAGAAAAALQDRASLLHHGPRAANLTFR